MSGESYQFKFVDITNYLLFIGYLLLLVIYYYWLFITIG